MSREHRKELLQGLVDTVGLILCGAALAALVYLADDIMRHA